MQPHQLQQIDGAKYLVERRKSVSDLPLSGWIPRAVRRAYQTTWSIWLFSRNLAVVLNSCFSRGVPREATMGQNASRAVNGDLP